MKKKYKLDVQVVGHPLTESEISDLDAALEKIRQRRPNDLKLLNTLVLIQSDFRGEADARYPHQIVIRGPYAIAREGGSVWPPQNYAFESTQSLVGYNTVDYLFQKLTHELGHLVNDRDRPGKAAALGLPSGYPRSVGVVDIAEQCASMGCFDDEWFAEDYSLYLMSGGQKVMSQTANHLTVGMYNETLEYLRQTYPLSLVNAD